MNNYWGTNFVPAQGGNFVFRYDLVSTQEIDPAALTRVGWNKMTPFEVSEVPGSFSAGRLPSNETKLLSINNPDVALITWKLAEDGRGSILRLEEIAGREGTVRLKSEYLTFTQAWRCSIVEESEEPVAVSNGEIELRIRPFEIVTLRIMSKPRLPEKERIEAHSR
jgi:alpha-mannosidase